MSQEFGLTQVLSAALQEVLQFLGLQDLIVLLGSGDSASLLSLDGLYALFAPLIPVLLIIEILAAIARGQFQWQHFRVPLLTLVTNGIIGRFISLAIAVTVASTLQPFALLETSFTWYWFVYGYLVWEFAHFIYHWAGHKVRLLWCIHSTHHAPQHMNLSVSYAHFFLEAPYADLVRIGICTLLGVDPLVLMIVIGIDAIWGSLIHIGEELMPDGRMGRLHKYILTPSHHRVHHAKNPVYVDTNYCNLLNVWDRVFGTYQEQDPNIRPEYGIKRKDGNNFFECYFGEIASLARDVRQTPRWVDKFRYLIMPPNWTPEEGTPVINREGAV
ncbi:sterol desaturase family protein [Biformimicrobium ophioploci]|uniref:Fatty acid hydroxylase domain-containing protein n=1 Tax=Biformimicrobium ophioploci TaxID=3036711 RepID=A0ABQ6LZ84_9GAMM|nr:sterol desaturase family protein [Microbulbifer sp. NKW57]GMG87352.1 hypothetical protein MNKW57_16730 [Microbulbifer sp. NKW57]